MARFFIATPWEIQRCSKATKYWKGDYDLKSLCMHEKIRLANVKQFLNAIEYINVYFNQLLQRADISYSIKWMLSQGDSPEYVTATKKIDFDFQKPDFRKFVCVLFFASCLLDLNPIKGMWDVFACAAYVELGKVENQIKVYFFAPAFAKRKLRKLW